MFKRTIIIFYASFPFLTLTLLVHLPFFKGYDSLDQLNTNWNIFIETPKCFHGTQSYGRKPDTGFIPEESVINETAFTKIINTDRDIVINFLFSKFDSRKITAVHVCPFNVATEGELAVYLLQHVTKINWYEVSDDYSITRTWLSIEDDIRSNEYKKMHGIYSAQNQLRKILSSAVKRNKLMEAWIHSM